MPIIKDWLIFLEKYDQPVRIGKYTTVWVVESGDYEDNHIDGIYSSLEKAVEGIKTKHDCYKSEGVWEEIEGNEDFSTLIKYLRYSKIQYDIRKWEVDGMEEIEPTSLKDL